MKLQISFDIVDLEKSISIAQQVADYADILEVGTLLIYKNGVHAVTRFREAFPKKVILADAKIVDRAKDAVSVFASAGADWITVMAGTSKNVIHAVTTAAHAMNKKIMLDLLDASSLGQSAMEAKNLGVDALLFHPPHDEKEAFAFAEKWEMVKGNTQLPIFVSAKIKRETITSIISANPHGIVVGKSITDADNPRQEAQFFYDTCKVDTSNSVI